MEVNLSQTIRQATVESDPAVTGGIRPRVLDVGKFRAAWHGLPEVARNAYPQAVRANIEAFIDAAQAAGIPLQVASPMLARSLMKPSGSLGRRLRGSVNEDENQ